MGATIERSDRDNPATFKCNCGGRVMFTLHSEYLEGLCGDCLQTFAAKVGISVWNCCSPPINVFIKDTELME